MSTAPSPRRTTRGRPPTDYTGRTFGDLTAFAPTDLRTPGGGIVWALSCAACGETLTADIAAVARGRIRCSCRLDLTGKVIGSVTVLAHLPVEPGTPPRCRVRCACGRPGAEFDVPRTRLSSAAAAKRRPACRLCVLEAFDHVDLRTRDLGYLEALERVVRLEGGGALWRVRCRAGLSGCKGEFLRSPGALIMGRVKSCGCYNESLKGSTRSLVNQQVHNFHA